MKSNPKLSTLGIERSSPSSSVTLLPDSPRTQILNPSVNIDVILPSLSAVFDIVNVSASTITVKSSNGDTVVTLPTGKVSLFGLSTNPSTSSDWNLETISNVNVNSSAAIAGTKIAPNFGSQSISTTGAISGQTLSTTGAISGQTLSAASSVTASSVTATTVNATTVTASIMRSISGTTSLTSGAAQAIFNAGETSQWLAIASFNGGSNSSSQAIAVITRRSSGTDVLINPLVPFVGFQWLVGSTASGRIDIRNNGGATTSLSYSVIRLR